MIVVPLMRNPLVFTAAVMTVGIICFSIGLGLAVNSWVVAILLLAGLAGLAAGAANAARLVLAKFRSSQYLLWTLQCDRAVREILSQPRYADPLRLNRFETKVYSQGGEDGVLQEIFRRIGVVNRTFCEFGAADGLQNNTVFLLNLGWGGLWIEGGAPAVHRASRRFASYIKEGKLQIKNAFVTAENIESLFDEARLPQEFDLLSLDIDRNDYYVWERIERYRPRVVVLEFSSIFPPGVDWVIPYDATAVWDGTSRTGASLSAYERLGLQKGYALVGCSLSGVNAFFVRTDLAEGKFAAPFTAENHYEPPRHFFNWYTPGQSRNP